MKSIILKSIAVLSLTLIVSCSQKNANIDKTKEQTPAETVSPINTNLKQTHRYGGWYCPDNLNGFPAVDIKNWASVPVINARMATKEETQSEASLIYVDSIEYPFASVLPIQMPKLARYYSYSSQKEEIIIVIQAINILGDSIVGFRYLNGGNGSSHLSEVTFLSDSEIEKISPSKFVSFSIDINATQAEIWKTLTETEYTKALQPSFDLNKSLKENWKNTSKVNFKYISNNEITAEYAANLYGNQYIQIDGEKDDYQYVEKFLLLENKNTHITEFKIVCGPYGNDFEIQKTILNNWAKKVKELSEKE